MGKKNFLISFFISLFGFYFKEEKSQQKAAEAKDVKLHGQFPPIEKMDASLSTLVNCEFVVLF
jgi:hypothetical protein